jgi:hypothetical protein
MDEFHNWDIVFMNADLAAKDGHPDAPNLSEYGISREQLGAYIDANKDIKEKRQQDKFDKTLNVVWFILFTAGIILVGYLVHGNFAAWIIGILYIIALTACVYLCHVHHFAGYNKELDAIYDKNIELYIENLSRYKHKFYEKITTIDDYTISESRNFTEEEIKAVKDAVVVLDRYGRVLCFNMKDGEQRFIPIYKTSIKQVGENVDLTSAKILTLTKPGEADIIRVEC